MSHQENSITGFAFYALAAISGLAALVATGTKAVPAGVGFAALMGAASLWWMGKVVSLLKQIAEGGMKPPAARQAEKVEAVKSPVQKSPEEKDVYRLD
jgi:Cu/Ag efflux pump CusA